MSSKPSTFTSVTGSGTDVKKSSAWVSARTNERALAQHAFASDPKYKKYTQQVEKCLNSFDNVHEWADFIAFLKHLLKTFQSYMQFKEIPRKLIVAKRLAQCLNPALPTGVHQRALDVYAHILAVLGSEGLKRDMPLWSSGLFPFFEYAATSVKPTLLNLYDTHYLPLQGALRPVMKSFILALLPGLEEETGEFFEKVLSLLDRLSGTVSPSFFFQNIWLVMLTTPSARGTSLNFISRRLPRLNANEDITSIIGRDIGLMVRAFSAALEDDNLLVRRAALDLLLQSMRADSAAVQKAKAEDRTILMRAATGVVLRRDLSLNRRLYSWLLGPDEKREQQMNYFREYVLELLKSTLKDEMFSPSGDYSQSRPFKIFISLLDKWEIGGPLTEILVYDAFKAVKHLVEAASDEKEDVTMTASTLYEAVEPRIIWARLLTSILTEITGDGTQHEAISMALFILKTFAQDEEIQTIHLPIIFSAIMDILDIQVHAGLSNASAVSMRECLRLQEEILGHISRTALMQRPELTGEIQEARKTQRPYLFACTFYGIEPTVKAPTPKGSFNIPFAFAFENLITLSVHFARNLMDGSSSLSLLRETFSQTLLLLDRLIDGLESPITLSWDPAKWLSAVLQSLEHEPTTFVTVDRTIALIVALHGTKSLAPNLSIDERPVMAKMVNKLLKYLRPDCAVYHARVVDLIRSLERLTKRSHVESILAQTMTLSESHNIQESYEAFGVLWRSTDDNLLPAIRYKIPLMLVLDTLKNDDPHLRRIGETWMRCSLKSYLRVLDLILFDLMSPTIRRTTSTAKVRGKELHGFLYERPFDQRYTNHLLEMLHSVTRFGGQGFAKTARSTPIRQSQHFVQRLDSSGIPDPDASYADVLIELLSRFLKSEPKISHRAVMQPCNSIIQSTSVDILQTIIARGEVDTVTLESIEAIVVGKLYFCIHINRLDLQNKLLLLLHSLISVSTSNEESSGNTVSGAQRQDDGVPEDVGAQDRHQESGSRGYSINPLLIQTLIDGITISPNRPVLQHWLDFILMTIPQFQPTLQAVVAPLNDCICRQVLLSLADVLQAASKDEGYEEDISSTATDAELIMLLNALERLVLLSLAYTSETDAPDDETAHLEKAGQENSGLLGYVSNVFGSDTTPNATEDQLTARSPGYRSLHEAVRVLFSIWSTLIWTDPKPWSPKNESLSLTYNRTRIRCGRVLEHLFRVQSAEVFESIVDCWNRDLPLPGVSGSSDAAFELVDVLIANAQSVVHMICESISCRLSGVSERTKRQAINPNLSDATLFRFLEQYLQRLEGPLAVVVWSRFLQLVKEIMSHAREFKTQNFPALCCLSVLAEKLTHTTFIDDRRIRKELQEIYARLLDSCVVFVGRSFDQGSWIRRTAKEPLNANGRESPGPRNDAKVEEKIASSASLAPETSKAGMPPEIIVQIIQFIATIALPNLRRFLIENDKVASACSNIVYYIVSPAIKGKSRPLEVDKNVIGIIQEMVRIPAALRVWRTPVTELVNDNRLFSCNPDDAEIWKPIVKQLFDVDKTAFPELLAKVSTAPSTNIFTSREYEMSLRSLNLRRLSLVLFISDKNHFITQLPTIQEKLVDILRTVSAPIVQSEVYLCIRVLICRLSPHNLTSFWPVLLTELYRLFEQVMTSLPSDGSEDLQLVLAASKCLDLLLALQTEEFQIHQWIFITDTVDAVYRPDKWFPEAMMDQLAEIAGSLPIGDSKLPSQVNNAAHFGIIATDQRPMRRPLLNSMRQIDSIRDLVPFFSHVSISSYESVYASWGNVDWDAVERGLMEDMFDGR